MLRFRWAVIVMTIAITAILAGRIGQLRVEIDPNRFLPQSHPYVVASDRVEHIFGSRYVLVVGITPLKGTIYDPAVLGKVDRITRRMREVPGVVKENILSFAARKAKSITGTDEGMEVRPLMNEVPANPAQIEELRRTSGPSRCSWSSRTTPGAFNPSWTRSSRSSTRSAIRPCALRRAACR
jgi:predicted RND superfamily exporter protein